MVPKCETVWDIGSDHAHIPIELIKRNICQKAYAFDINEGPTKKADTNIKLHKLENRILAITSPGLSAVDFESIKNTSSAIIIAGMGGQLVKNILEEAENRINSSVHFILQPMSAVSTLRKFLYENGFVFVDEELTCEDRRIYTCFLVKRCNAYYTKTENIRLLNIHIGEILISKRHPLLNKYIERKLRILDNSINGIKKSINKDDLDRLDYFVRVRREVDNLYKSLNY